jgi:hypothetical protein
MDKDLHTFVGTELVQGTWEDIVLEVGGSYSLGDFQAYRGEVTEALRKSLFIMPRYMSGSDYSGGSVQCSNHKAFLDKFGKIEGVYDIYGGFGTYGIAIRLDVYEDNLEIKEAIDNLDDYPLFDEEAHSELEMEWQQEFITSELSHFCYQIDLEYYIPEIDEILKDEGTIESYIWESIDPLDLEFQYDNTGSYVDLDKVKPYVEDRLIIEHAKQFPLFINREWSCKETEEMFKKKLTGDE